MNVLFCAKLFELMMSFPLGSLVFALEVSFLLKSLVLQHTKITTLLSVYYESHVSV